jgi:hypothetical protein
MRFLEKLGIRVPRAETAKEAVFLDDFVRGRRAPVGPLGLFVSGGLADIAPVSPREQAWADSWQMTTPCPSCHGQGVLRGAGGWNQQCPNCGGSGSRDTSSRRFFDYVFPTVLMTPGQVNVTQTLELMGDVPFEIYWIVASSILANGNAGLWSVYVLDSTGYPWTPSQQTPVFGECFAGTAQLPFRLPEPYTLAKNASLQGIFTERSNVGGQNNTLQLVMRGYKLYPSASQTHGRAGTLVPTGSAA